MKSNREMRQLAWNEVKRQGWRIFGSSLLFWLALFAIAGTAIWLSKVCQVYTWNDFFKLQQSMGGETGLVPPNLQSKLMLTAGSAFEAFLNCLVNGLTALSMAGLTLGAIKNPEGSRLKDAFAAMGSPFACAWLYFSIMLRLVIWMIPAFACMAAGINAAGLPRLSWCAAGVLVSSLLVLKAIYAYMQAWRLKTENPDWGAGQCIRASIRMMKGYKWKAVSFDCSYWLHFLVAILLTGAGMTCLSNSMVAPGVSQAAMGAGFMLAAAVYSTVLSIYFMLGRAVFYRELQEERNNDITDR